MACMADTHTDSKGSKAQPIFGVENFEKSNDLGAQLNKKIVQKWQKKKRFISNCEFSSEICFSRMPKPTNTMQKEGLHEETRVCLRSAFIEIRKFLCLPNSLEISQ